MSTAASSSSSSAPSASPIDPALVPVKPAATVMLIRDASDGAPGVEVFMLRRTANAVFGAGMFVFPGGRVDGVDGAHDIAKFCQGLDDRAASAQLGIERGGLAYWVAAVRECFEEAGVLLATSRTGSPLALRNEDRHEIHDSSLSLVELCRRDDLVLDLSSTFYVDHWITPIGEQRRFDTRFFVTEAPADQEPLHDDKETVESLWVRPGRSAADAGRR
jgi:8-oxo-dGTP pyrophosphatase MutT (NUDIX family)